MAASLHFPAEDAAGLEPYLPPLVPSHQPVSGQTQSHRLPFVTLTFATSMDSSLAIAPGVRTTLSGPQSKAMTHYLRSRHDAICVGVGTAVADDPGLNCRIAARHGASVSQPRPIVIDPHDRWPLSRENRVLDTARRGQGLAPFVVTAVREPDVSKRQLLESHGGKYIVLDAHAPPSGVAGLSGEARQSEEPARFRWEDILETVAAQGLRSIMIEGGAGIINPLLAPANSDLVNSVIVTIAPTWLGRGGVVVSPSRPDEAGHDQSPRAAARLTNVKWQQLGEDVIVCGRLIK